MRYHIKNILGRLVDLVQLLLVELLRELHLLLGTIGVQLPVYFGLDVVGEFRRRAAIRLKALSFQALPRRTGEDFHGIAMQARDDRLRRACGSEQPVPG